MIRELCSLFCLLFKMCPVILGTGDWGLGTGSLATKKDAT